MAARPLANPVTYGTIIGSAPMSDLDTSFGAVFTSGFNDSALGWVNYAADIGTLNVLAATLAQAPSGYTAGLTVAIKVANTNTSAATLNLNSIGAQPIVNRANIALQGGELPLNAVVPMVYDGTSFRIIGPCHLGFLNNAATGTVTIECAGYNSISALVNFTSGTPGPVVLSHLAQGVPVTLLVQNSVGSSQTIQINATLPSGGSYTTINAYPSNSGTGVAATNMVTGITQATGSFTIYTGSAYSNTAIAFTK